MARLARAGRCERREAGPVAGLVLLLGEPAARARPAHWRLRRASGRSHAAASKAAEAWPKAQAWTCWETCTTRPSSSSCDRNLDPAAAGRRAQLGAAVLASRARAARAATPPAAGFRSCRAARSFPAPSRAAGPSSKTMPSAFSSSRMRSAAAKSRVLLGLGALGNASFDRCRCIAVALVNQFVRRVLVEQPKQAAR